MSDHDQVSEAAQPPVVEVTPQQELALEVLAARYRLGEAIWTFRGRHAPVLRELEAKGLVFTMHGVVERTVRAGLTDGGREAVLSDTYAAPSGEQERNVSAVGDLQVGARVAFLGEGGGTGAISEVRQAPWDSWYYRVAWDDGTLQGPELGRDEIAPSGEQEQAQ